MAQLRIGLLFESLPVCVVRDLAQNIEKDLKVSVF